MLDISLRMPPDAELLTALGAGLTAVNLVLMARAPDEYPCVFDRAMRLPPGRCAGRPTGPLLYRREAIGPDGVRLDEWLTADQLLSRHYGDCEDIAAYHAAWLRLRGRDARFIVTRNPSGNFHARTWVNGRIVDACRVLIDRERRERWTRT